MYMFTMKSTLVMVLMIVVVMMMVLSGMTSAQSVPAPEGENELYELPPLITSSGKELSIECSTAVRELALRMVDIHPQQEKWMFGGGYSVRGYCC